MLKIIKNASDIQDLEFGDEYAFDYPELPAEGQDNDKFLQAMDDAQKKNSILQRQVEKKFEKTPPGEGCNS